MRDPEKDFSTKWGAEKLMADIERYWALQGKVVDLWAEPLKIRKRDIKSSRGETFFVVRSNMVNGTPQ